MNSILNLSTQTNPEELSKQILLSKNPDLNLYAVLNLGINKTKHLQVIVDSQDPSLNYRCARHCIKTKTLSKEEKIEFATKHCQVVFESSNEKLIYELQKFVKYNPIGKEYHPIRHNSKTKHR